MGSSIRRDTERWITLTLRQRLLPKSLDFVGLEPPRFRKGIAPSISQLGLNLNSVFHRYGEPPARITAAFRQGVVLDVYVGRGETIFATVQESSDWIGVLPQIGPLLTEEYLPLPGNLYQRECECSACSRRRLCSPGLARQRDPRQRTSGP